MRRSNSSPSVALFPFLAVLVCAMGALILLLLITTRKMRQVAVARAMAEEEAAEQDVNGPPAAEPPQIIPESERPNTEPSGPSLAGPALGGPSLAGPASIPSEPTAEELAARAAERRALQVARAARKRINTEARERQAKRERDWQRQLVELESNRENARQKLQETRTLVEDLKGRLQRTEVDLEKLNDKKDQFATRQEQDAQLRAKVEQQHQQLTEAVTKAQQELADLRKAHAEASSQFAFIPYDGALGTTRRPIYLECTAAGIRFQPEGVLLGEDDLKGFTESQNPLLYATQAIMEYWRTHSPPGDDPRNLKRPYVLLLVRPSGTVTYYVARKMLTDMGDDFGYELIEDDFPIQLPPTDGKTTLVIERAIAEALRYRGESLADGVRVGVPRPGQVIMGRSEDPIDFGTLDSRKAAALAQKESPFSRNTTRQGKNFSITRSPIREDELLPETFRTELERHSTETSKRAANGTQAAATTGQSAGMGGNGAGATAGSNRETPTGPTTGPGAAVAASSGTGARNANPTSQAPGGTGLVGSSLDGALSGGTPSGGLLSGRSDSNGSGVEIQRGRGRRHQFGKDTGAETGQANGNAPKIPRLPALTDPFSRQALADGPMGPEMEPDEVALNGDDPDAALGFSGGADATGSGANSTTTNAGGGGTGAGTRGGTGVSIPGTRPGNFTDLNFNKSQDTASGDSQPIAAGEPGGPTRQPAAGQPIPGVRTATVMNVDPATGVDPGTSAGASQGAMRGAAAGAVHSARTRPAIDGIEVEPGELGAMADTAQRGSVPGTGASNGTRTPGGTRAVSGSGSGAGNVANPFDRTIGEIQADKVVVDAERNMNGGAGGAPAGSAAAKKTYGNNQAQVQRRAPKMTAQQKQDIGRQRWGGSNVGQIGFEKKVKVQVLADRIVIGKQEVEIEVEPGTTREELVEAVLDGLDNNSQSWGKPPKKFYWIPYLQFEVYKGGVVQYEQLHGPLQEWGIYSDVKFQDGQPNEPGLIRPASKSEPIPISESAETNPTASRSTTAKPASRSTESRPGVKRLEPKAR